MTTRGDTSPGYTAGGPPTQADHGVDLQTLHPQAIVTPDGWSRSMTVAARHAFVRLVTPCLVVAAVLGVVLSAGSLPHSHQPSLPGLYNQEHDLTQLAAVGGLWLLADSPSVGPIALAMLLVVPAISWWPRTRPRRLTDNRAPPVR